MAILTCLSPYEEKFSSGFGLLQIGTPEHHFKNVKDEPGLGTRIILRASTSHDVAIEECDRMIQHAQREKMPHLSRKNITKYYKTEIIDHVPAIFRLPKDITQTFITQTEPIQWFDQLFYDYGLAIIDCDLKQSKITKSLTKAQLQP
jgi:hypothetical protein